MKTENDLQLEKFVTGTGQLIWVHIKNDSCDRYGCCVHNPTDPHLDWPTHWRQDRYLMERICPCGVGHPDHDHIARIRRIKGEEVAYFESVHGCCEHGCSEIARHPNV